ncbi:MAG TPA: hypothetical protein VF861_04740 [Telluria sp.]
MKRVLLAISASVGLACAVSLAHADDRVMINQNSSGGSVQVEQNGGMGMNQVMVNQGQPYFYAEGWGGNQVMVMQNQVTDSNATVDQNGPGTNAHLEQTQTFLGFASIMQNSFGGNLSADIIQSGAYNRADISQFGSNMSASISQGYGTSNNTATIIQRH